MWVVITSVNTWLCWKTVVIEVGIRKHSVYATTIPDAWFQLVHGIFEYGHRYTIEKGSYEGETRLEYDWVDVLIEHPYNEIYDQMLPDIPAHLGIPNPVEPGYVERYLPYLMSSHIEPGEDYTYGNRIFDQVVSWIEALKTTPNTNQAILQVARPEDVLLADPPCLRHIDMRVKDGKLIFYPYFRSWDLWGGLPANLAGIAVLQKFMADSIGVESGPILASSKGLHIYKYVEQLAKLRVGKV